ncbi:MAG: hypothetical protein KatS3mg053_3145 [Candidatus Roseilinea sp.]|nr:MAG: hypothetical protein KatS3mg053_3145 [Candidatus Roseilinea sp.]
MATLPRLTLPQKVKEGAVPSSTIAVVLDAALDAYRAGAFDELLLQRPGVLQWASRRYLQPILGTAGDRLPPERRLAAAAELLLRWAVTQLRPDRAPTLELNDRAAWLERTSWRPFIAVMCHYGFAPVPDFRDRYYRRPGESAADNLCGLWNVGQSTFYRYLEKGRRLIARLLHEQRLDRRHTPSLRAFVWCEVIRSRGFASEAERADWHRRQAQTAIQANDAPSAFWHMQMAGDVKQVCQFTQRHLALLADESEFKAAWRALLERDQPPAERIALLLTDAAIHQMRGDAEGEQAAYEEALHLAAQSHDARRTGIVCSRLGRFYEPRDSDRAFAYYQEAAALLAEADAADDPEALEEHAAVLVRTAWLYALRNDPRARPVLERVEALRSRTSLDDGKQALIEQAWGEYWRRAGDTTRALEHTHHALSIYEKVNDPQGIVKAYINLSLAYGEARQFERAIECGKRVLDMANRIVISAEAMASTYLNLGANYFWLGDYDAAITYYQRGLEVATEADLRLHVRRAHYNLAEAFYTRFRLARAPEDERQGDAHVQAALEAWPHESDSAHIALTKNLKQEILGESQPRIYDRFLPQEAAAHYAEMAEIERQRATLAAPGEPEAHVRAHLAIANAYLAISVKEREAALALIEKHGLGDRFANEFERLRATFEQTLTREQKLKAEWKAKAGDLLNDARRAAVLRHLLERRAINKSAYAELCGVGPATASKHLVHLAALGLLKQIGRGPSTHYVLPEGITGAR